MKPACKHPMVVKTMLWEFCHHETPVGPQDMPASAARPDLHMALCTLLYSALPSPFMVQVACMSDLILKKNLDGFVGAALLAVPAIHQDEACSHFEGRPSTFCAHNNSNTHVVPVWGSWCQHLIGLGL